MKLDQLTQEILLGIFRLYKETAGCSLNENRCPKLEDVIKCFQRGYPVEYRLGSKFSGHSKLYISHKLFSDDLEFSFYPNQEPRNKREEKQMAKTAETFEKSVNDYLENLKTLYNSY